MRFALGTIVAVGIGLSTAPATAAFQLWNQNSSGANDLFSWSNGGDDNQLYGDPTIASNGDFVFEPDSFSASVAPGENPPVAQATDRLEIDLLAIDDYEFTTVTVIEGGTYELAPGGPAGVQVVASLQLTRFNGANDPVVIQALDVILDADGPGTWRAEATIDLTALGDPGNSADKSLILVAANQISALGAGSSISKDFARIIVPEPSVAALMLLVVAATARRR